ncbi:MAG TPA: sodium:solute symporter family protein [Candidatus Acidoferrales bacterium]|nr:sodium:solute symporter family protein [Candidatus Acidoferrales bacterium]
MLYAVVLIGILAVLLAVSIHRSFFVKSKADFMVAGRRLGWPVLVFTLLSSWIGAGSLFAGAENAFHNGFASLWQPAGGWVGLVVIVLIAGRARRFAQYTVPDLLEARYDSFARVCGTVAIVIAYTGITSYQFRAGGDILHLIFPDAIGRQEGMYIIALFVITFTALAGMSSVAYLDLVIGLLVTVTACVALPVLIGVAGGWSGVRAALPNNHFTVLGPWRWYQALNYFLPVLFLLLGNQAMYQKFFSARSERDAKISVAGWILGTLLLETVIIALAVVGSALYKDAVPREIIPVAARAGLPAVLGALLLGGVFAKVISTGNNYLFSPASNLIHDVYHRFLNPQASERQLLVFSRLIVIGLGVFAVLLAAHTESILRVALYAYTVYGAGVTPAVLAAFFWKRANAKGALASIVIGTAITISWNLMADYGPPSAFASLARDVDAVVPALIFSLLALVTVSLATPAPPEEKWRAVMPAA